MKKLLSLLALLTTMHIFAAEPVKLYDQQETKQLLGYDPRITLLEETDKSVVKSGRKTVYLHGFGASKRAAKLLKGCYGTQRLPGDIITFDFADANNNGMDLSQSSLGQWNDIKTALYVLKKLHDAGETEIGINAHSRGGATAINMVAVLTDTKGKYNTRLSELGIDDTTRTAILTMLQRGHIVLECPLVSVSKVIQHHIKQTSTSLLGNWITNLFSSLSAGSAKSANYAAPLVLRKYRAWEEQAIDSVDTWNNANIPTIVHFQEYDEVLGNDMDMEFFTKLQRSNGYTHTYLHKGRDFGHNSSLESFDRERNLFLKLYGASYDRESVK